MKLMKEDESDERQNLQLTTIVLANHNTSLQPKSYLIGQSYFLSTIHFISKDVFMIFYKFFFQLSEPSKFPSKLLVFRMSLKEFDKRIAHYFIYKIPQAVNLP